MQDVVHLVDGLPVDGEVRQFGNAEPAVGWDQVEATMPWVLAIIFIDVSPLFA